MPIINPPPSLKLGEAIQMAFVKPQCPSINELLLMSENANKLSAEQKAALIEHLEAHAYTYEHWVAYKTLLYDLSKNSQHLAELAEALPRFEGSLTGFHNLVWQLRNLLFRNAQFIPLEERYRISETFMRPAYNRVIDRLRPSINASFQMKYKPRVPAKKVAILTPQFLGDMHSPSRQCMAIAHSLKHHLGLEPHIVNCNALPADNRFNVLRGFSANCTPGLNGMQEVTMEYLGNKLECRFYSAVHRPFDLLYVMEVLTYLEEMQIDAVICSGDLLFIQDFVYPYFPSLYSTLGGGFPFTPHHYYWLWGQRNEVPMIQASAETLGKAEDCWGFHHGIQILFDRGEPLQRAQYHIPEDAFVYVMVGNRLHAELDKEYLAFCERLLEQEKAYLVMIGWDETLTELVLGDFGQHPKLRLLPYQTKLRPAMALGDVFLNNFREGGATAGTIAIQENMPIVTLADCNNGSLAGPLGSCGTKDHYYEAAFRMYEDPEYRENVTRVIQQHVLAQSNDDTIAQMFDKLTQVGETLFANRSPVAV